MSQCQEQRAQIRKRAPTLGPCKSVQEHLKASKRLQVSNEPAVFPAPLSLQVTQRGGPHCNSSAQNRPQRKRGGPRREAPPIRTRGVRFLGCIRYTKKHRLLLRAHREELEKRKMDVAPRSLENSADPSFEGRETNCACFPPTLGSLPRCSPCTAATYTPRSRGSELQRPEGRYMHLSFRATHAQVESQSERPQGSSQA